MFTYLHKIALQQDRIQASGAANILWEMSINLIALISHLALSQPQWTTTGQKMAQLSSHEMTDKYHV